MVHVVIDRPFLYCTGDDYQGKLLLHNEHSILSLLQDQVGVIHHHGLFRNGTNVILVLDCLYQHGDDDGQHKVYLIIAWPVNKYAMTKHTLLVVSIYIALCINMISLQKY